MEHFNLSSKFASRQIFIRNDNPLFIETDIENQPLLDMIIRMTHNKN